DVVHPPTRVVEVILVVVFWCCAGGLGGFGCAGGLGFGGCAASVVLLVPF
ncbi:hypothetical protein A2U01_0056115, partial [Trifolium medium]|nr:hypothetical protein [Trifolium medium]